MIWLLHRDLRQLNSSCCKQAVELNTNDSDDVGLADDLHQHNLAVHCQIARFDSYRLMIICSSSIFEWFYNVENISML